MASNNQAEQLNVAVNPHTSTYQKLGRVIGYPDRHFPWRSCFSGLILGRYRTFLRVMAAAMICAAKQQAAASLNTTSARKLLTIYRKYFDNIVTKCVTVDSNSHRNVLQNLELVAFNIQPLPRGVLHRGCQRAARGTHGTRQVVLCGPRPYM
jgi:hypothetical protein